MNCIVSIDQVLEATKPEDLFGELPASTNEAIQQASKFWRSCATIMHPDVNDDPRAEQAMRILNQMIEKVRAGKYGEANVEVLIRTRRNAYKLTGMMAQGDTCNIYTGTYGDDLNPVVVKIVRDRRSNDLIASEAKTLKRLLSNIKTYDAIEPYVPGYIETFGYRENGSKQPRQAIAFRRDLNLYTLEEVRQNYPHGVHAKDAAWMLRRLLFVLALTHENGIVHGAVTPAHVLIEPDHHGVVLVDWKYAVDAGQKIAVIPARWKDMYPMDVVLDKKPSTFGVDLFMAARCMAYVMGGDPNTGELPDHQPRQIAAFLRGTAVGRASRRPQIADEIRNEYTDLIERLWGPRRFRPFSM